MAEIRDSITKDEIINFLTSIGISVHLNTKARGHNGFCTTNRIDVSKKLPQDKIVDVLLHEFAHYVHFKLEPGLIKSQGTIEKLFNLENESVKSKLIESELYQISLIIFDNSSERKLKKLKKIIGLKIENERQIIKEEYPEFQSSKKFKEFDKYIKNSDARFLLRYDRVLIKRGILFPDKLIGISTLETDFSNMPKAFKAYLRMKSYERHRNRLTAKLSKINRYLKYPTELFARFFQMYCCDNSGLKGLAPISYERFEELRKQNYYPYVEELFSMIKPEHGLFG